MLGGSRRIELFPVNLLAKRRELVRFDGRCSTAVERRRLRTFQLYKFPVRKIPETKNFVAGFTPPTERNSRLRVEMISMQRFSETF